MLICTWYTMNRLFYLLIVVCCINESIKFVEPTPITQQDDLEEVTEKIFFDVTIGGVSKVSRIVFGLFGNTVPLTVKNFATICTEGVNNNTYNFNGTIFHRVIRRFMIQGRFVCSFCSQVYTLYYVKCRRW